MKITEEQASLIASRMHALRILAHEAWKVRDNKTLTTLNTCIHNIEYTLNVLGIAYSCNDNDDDIEIGGHVFNFE